MRTLIMLVLVGLSSLAAGQATRETVDLNEPGALEQLERTNPAHDAKIQAILAGIRAQPEERVAAWIEATFDAEDATYGAVMLTSVPPKRRLSVTLDGVEYRAVVTLVDFYGRLIPAR